MKLKILFGSLVPVSDDQHDLLIILADTKGKLHARGIGIVIFIRLI